MEKGDKVGRDEVSGERGGIRDIAYIIGKEKMVNIWRMPNMGTATGFVMRSSGKFVPSGTTVAANVAPCHRQWAAAAPRVHRSTMVRIFLRHIFRPDTPTLSPYRKVPVTIATVSDTRTALTEYVQLRTLHPVGPNVHFASLHQSSNCQPP